VFVFRGIPYAAPPIGALRWKAPQPVVPWDGVRLCDKFGHPGYQAVHYPGGYASEWGYGDESPYSEDCLYLNVWTKGAGQPGSKLPVALWMHGGILSTLIDEVCGWVVTRKLQTSGYTVFYLFFLQNYDFFFDKAT